MPRTARSRRRIVCLLASSLAVGLLACSVVSAPYALAATAAEGQALQELTEGSPESTQTTTTSAATTSTSTPSNSHTTSLLAALAAVVLLCAIGFVIARDARRVARRQADMAEARSSRDPAVMLAQAPRESQAARQQRKRNR